MAHFSYVAIDKNGKEKKATVESDSVEKVELQLRKDGLIPISVKESSALSQDISLGKSNKIKPRDMGVFCRQFVSMTSAGVSIIDALAMLKDQTENKKLAAAISDTKDEVQKGHTLAESMGSQPVFDEMFVNMIDAGEASGNIETAFSRMAVQFEKNAKVQGLVKKSMMYPMVLCVVAVAVFLIMVLKVIPGYATMFSETGMTLPGITIAMMSISEFLKEYWYLVLLAIAGVVFLIKMYKKTEQGKAFFGKLAIKIPIFGKLNVKTYSALFARTLSTLLYSGIPMIDAIDAVANTMKNTLFKNQLKQARAEVAKGIALSEPLRNGGLFPPMVVHMLSIGEETGNIEEMLDKLANYYDEEVEITTQTVMAAMEPMIIVVMALIVVILIAAIMAPMLAMYDQLGNI